MRLRLARPCLFLSLFLVAVTLTAAGGRGRHKKLYAVPAPATVVVDGKLDDWDLSGQILSYVIPETADMQSARVAMMYDAEALYVSAVVRDSSPMMNRHDPRIDPDRAWDADVVQLWYSLDPDLPYPIEGSSFSDQEVAPVATAYLWYFTDRQEPNLVLLRGMKNKRPVRPEFPATGVIPHDRFAATYVKADDGGGYTLEYRIPWTTLGVLRQPVADDILAGQVSIFWSRPDGLKTAGGAAWAYDVMGAPGFPFQNAGCWGKLIFSPTGNVDRSLVEEGLPPEKPLPLKFAYDVPEDSEVTVQFYNTANEVVRLLVAQGDRRAGRNVELWDGLDDRGNPLPAGTYTWKGIYHQPITQKALFSAHNSGQPPWPTDNNRGGWGGDHGDPTTVCAVKDGMLLAWSSCEYGWGTIRVDLDGRKLWGSKHDATYLATDGKRIFLAGGHGFQAHAGIQVLDLRDARPLNFANGSAVLAPPPGGTDDTNTATGLACDRGRIYVAYAARDLVGVFDAKSGDLATTWDVPAPGRLAVRPDGALLAISAGQVVTVADGQVAVFTAEHLAAPRGIAVGPDGTVYVTNAGAMQDVSVFTADGTLKRRVGKPGGRPAVGRYDAAGMYMPGGIAVDDRGRLWVAETTDSPKRVSVWDPATGSNVNEFFGGCSYFAYGYIDPDHPDFIWAHNVLWKIDWQANTVAPYATTWRKTAADMMDEPDPAAYGIPARCFRAANGREYMFGGVRHKGILYRRDGDLFKPFLAICSIGHGWSLYRGQNIPLLDDPEQYPNGHYLWQDANDDQCVQANEVVKFTGQNDRIDLKWLDKDLTIWFSGGRLLRPHEIAANGRPVYDPKALETNFLATSDVRYQYLWPAADGSIYTLGFNKGPALVKWSATGELLWDYPGILAWRHALNLPIVKAGRLWGMTGPLGIAGEFTGNASYFGVCHLFRQDGVYVAALMQDGRAGGRPELEGQPEGQGGTFVKLNIAGADRYFLISGGQDARVIEVGGLDTVRDLAGGAYEHTAAAAGLAKAKLDEYQQALAGSQRLTVVRGRKALDLAQPVGRAVDSDRNFEARAAYDSDNLYIRYDVVTPAELINGVSDPKIIFRGGNCLDLQLAADPDAPADRTTPAPGDLRLLVTRQQKQPLAVLYRPRVAGFTGEPTVLSSPTGSESFAAIEVVDGVGLTYRKTGEGFTADVTIPLALIGWQPRPGAALRLDVGYIFGNKQGTRTTTRAYWRNNSFTANVVNDIPHESRLEPAEWGDALVE